MDIKSNDDNHNEVIDNKEDARMQDLLHLADSERA
jgi:hypothetical protein